MGLFSGLMNFAKTNAQNNAVLASHMFEEVMPASTQRAAVDKLVVYTVTTMQLGSIEKSIEFVSNLPRAIQMQAVANICVGYNIPTGVPNYVFYKMPTPFLVNPDWVKDSDILAAIQRIKQATGVEIKWPGNHIGLDFQPVLTEFRELT